MKEYICKEDLSEKVQGRVIFTHEIDELPTITKADILHEFEEWYAEHGDYSEVQLYEFKHKWKRWIEDFIAETEQGK